MKNRSKSRKVSTKNSNEYSDYPESLSDLLNPFKKTDYGEVRRTDVFHTEYFIEFDEEIKDPNYYRPVYEILDSATSEDIIYVELNTPGGNCDTLVQVYNKLQKTPAKTIAKIYQAVSAGAYIALSCDEIQPQPFCSMMIHNVSTGSDSKIQEFKDFATFTSAQNAEFLNKLAKGFLTTTEIEDIKKGVDLWLNESQIKQKLKNWKPVRKFD